MARKLCDLKDVFGIQGRGVILVLPNDEEWEISRQEVVHRHERIRLLDSHGKRVDSFIKDLDFTARNEGRQSDLCITLPRNVTLEMFSMPCEVWLERDGGTPVLWDGTPPK